VRLVDVEVDHFECLVVELFGEVVVGGKVK
jgi:hypothetical protein